jgi:ribosomal protein S18 acetylase RimI-like enzyme
MIILNSTQQDIPTIFSLYEAATNYQKTKFNRWWQPFDPVMVQREIEEGRQWKILIDGEVACIFAIAFADPEIWGAKNADPAIYIHRIVTHPAFKGRGIMHHIVEWAKEYAKTNNRQYIRMDTWGDNDELVGYYVKCGFSLLGTITPAETGALPAHYNCISLALLQIDVC